MARVTEEPITVEHLLAEARSAIVRLSPVQTLVAVQRGAALIDIRTETQRQRDGVIPHARAVPRNVVEWRCDPASSWRDPALADRGRQLVLICDEGYQSSLVAATLRRFGFRTAADVIGGFQAWRAAGLPVSAFAA